MIIKKCCKIIKGPGADETRVWLKNGKAHRDNAPAEITYGMFLYNHMYVYGYRMEWRQNGLLHNDDGPSITFSFTNKRYYHLDGAPYGEGVYWEDIERRKAAKENI